LVIYDFNQLFYIINIFWPRIADQNYEMIDIFVNHFSAAKQSNQPAEPYVFRAHLGTVWPRAFTIELRAASRPTSCDQAASRSRAHDRKIADKIMRMHDKIIN
jgi:hypothetical protein